MQLAQEAVWQEEPERLLRKLRRSGGELAPSGKLVE
jgi:hypothetical protein